MIQLEFADGSTLANARSPHYPGNQFRFWLLEAVCTWDHGPLGDNKELYANARWSRDGSSVRQTSQVPRLYSYTLFIKPAIDKMDLQIQLTNESPNSWENTVLPACFQLNESPSFCDWEGERTFVVVDGRYRAITQTNRVEPVRWQNYLLTERELPLQNGLVYGHQPLSPQRVSNGLIGVLSKDGRSVAGVIWNCVGYVFYNQHPDFCCIHSQPLLGHMKPGQTKRVKGTFYLLDGGMKELEAKAREDYGERLGNCMPQDVQ
jgi:hypothetical protein